MSRIEWDKIGEHYFEHGCDHGVVYPYNKETKYNTGAFPWNGLTNFTESPEGAEANDIYADNIKYASLRSAETLKCSIEAYTYPDEFAVLDGSVSPVKGVYVGQQPRGTFGFSCRTNVDSDTTQDTDDGYKLHLIYGATASPSEKAYETDNDSPDAITFSWDIDTTPVPINVKVGGKKLKPTASIVIDTTKLDAEGKTKLAALEDILYGTDGTNGSEGTEGRLPLPDEVFTLMGYVEPQG
jgi:hypothetical protein